MDNNTEEQNLIVNEFQRKFTYAFRGKDFTRLVDLLAGYSLRDEYETSVIRRLKIKDDRHYLPYFVIYLKQDGSTNLVIDGHKVPLVVRVDLANKIEQGHGEPPMFSYDNKFIGSRINLPINLNSEDYYFNYHKKKFFHKGDEREATPVNLRQIYARLLALHLSQLNTAEGRKIRIRLLIKRIIPFTFFKWFSFLLGCLHWIINGIRYTYDPFLEAFREESRPRQVAPAQVQPENEINFFGYNVRTWTLFSYSLLTLMVITLLYLMTNGLAGILRVNNSYLLLLYAIVSIVTWDRLLPLGIKKLVKLIGNKKSNLEWKGIELD